jgi:hypothetical protein
LEVYCTEQQKLAADPNNAIDFSKSVFAGNNEAFYSVPLKNIAAGTYKWLRVSLAYQNYDIKSVILKMMRYLHHTTTCY